LFFDTGNAWDKGNENLHGSFGAGARVSLGYVTVLRFDLSRNLDTKSWVFDFFFGWNF
jgi:outer membrane translocation and assembly module TamA